MASFIVYVRNTKVEELNRWLSNPDYSNPDYNKFPFTQEDVKIYMEEKDPEFILMMIIEFPISRA